MSPVLCLPQDYPREQPKYHYKDGQNNTNNQHNGDVVVFSCDYFLFIGFKEGIQRDFEVIKQGDYGSQGADNQEPQEDKVTPRLVDFKNTGEDQ